MQTSTHAPSGVSTGWRRHVGCLMLQVIFHKRDFLRKMTWRAAARRRRCRAPSGQQCIAAYGSILQCCGRALLRKMTGRAAARRWRCRAPSGQQCIVVYGSMLQCVVVCCSVLQCKERRHLRDWARCKKLQHITTHCSTLQHTEDHCNICIKRQHLLSAWFIVLFDFVPTPLTNTRLVPYRNVEDRLAVFAVPDYEPTFVKVYLDQIRRICANP